MKIYIVADGEYSDYHIEGVFSTKEKAEDFQRRFGYSDYIGEWELDSRFEERKGMTFFKVAMKENGDSECDRAREADGYIPCYFDNNNENRMILFVWAKNEKHAVKIANEKRSVILSNNKWGEDEFLDDLYKKENGG